MLAPDFALLSDRLTPFLELFDYLKSQEEEIETKIVWLQSKERFKMAARTGTSPMLAIIDDIFKVIIFNFFLHGTQNCVEFFRPYYISVHWMEKKNTIVTPLKNGSLLKSDRSSVSFQNQLWGREEWYAVIQGNLTIVTSRVVFVPNITCKLRYYWLIQPVKFSHLMLFVNFRRVVSLCRRVY